jgi:hypothetical protein
MDMVGHQAVTQQSDTVETAILLQQILVDVALGIRI